MSKESNSVSQTFRFKHYMMQQTTFNLLFIVSNNLTLIYLCLVHLQANVGSMETTNDQVSLIVGNLILTQVRMLFSVYATLIF